MKKQSPKLNMGQYDENHYYKLCERSTEKCEFCDSDFQNRYRCLIHTAKHIIIPLIKHEIFQCYYCMFCFTSKEDLASHKKTKHKDNYLNELMEQVVSNTIAVKCEKIDLSPIKDFKNDTEDNDYKDTLENSYRNEESQSDQAINANNLIIKKFNEYKSLKQLNELNNEASKLSVCNPTEVKTLKPHTHLKSLLIRPPQPMTHLQNTINAVTITPVIRNPNTIKKPINHQMILNNYNNTDEEFILPDISPVINVSDIDDKEIKTLSIEISDSEESVTFEPVVETYQPVPNLNTRIAPYNDLTILNRANPKPESLIMKESLPSPMNINYTENNTSVPSTSKISFINGVFQKPKLLQMQTEDCRPLSNFVISNYGVNNISVPSNSKIMINGGNKKPEPQLQREESMPSSKFVSIHYDDLVKPGMFRCKKCGLTFPNKFDVITHETAAHFGFKKKKYIGAMHCTFCDWYIAGNYRSLDNHIETKHKYTKMSRHHGICEKCKLKYTNKIRHDHIYHQKPINITAPLIPKAKEIKKIDKSFLCDVCSMFFKNNNKCGKFTTEGVLQEYGKKYKCTNCHSRVDAVEIFKIYRYYLIDNNQLPEEQCMRDTKITNEVRLKNIQRRLIRMKK